MARIASGAAALHPLPQQSLDDVVALLGGAASSSAKPEHIVVIPFVGTFDGNAFAAKTTDGKPMIALPIERPGSELTMTHEFTHAVNESLGGLWAAGEQTVGTLMFTEGLAMRATERLHPGEPEFSYVSLTSDWFTNCQREQGRILRGLEPHLLDTGETAITQFTYGTGASGLTREAYCGGWLTVGYLLHHGWTFPALAHLGRAQINPLMGSTLAQLLQSGQISAGDATSGVPQTPGVSTTDVKQPAFLGRLYKPNDPTEHNTGILLIGGTEGHLYTADDIGPKLASLGYVVLGLDYHDAYDSRRKFSNTPLESFISAVAWLKAGVSTLLEHVIAVGYSRGLEAALLTAAYDQDVNGVAVFSPSSVVWGAMGSTDPKGPSGWSYQGKLLPFLIPSPRAGAAAFAEPLADRTKAGVAAIPVARIAGPVFLAASDADAIWPSARMARDVQNTLQNADFFSSVTLMTFNHASHRLLARAKCADRNLQITRRDQSD